MTHATLPSAEVPPGAPTPWWRVGFVWLVFGGPAVVVVAALITVAIAVSGAEEVLTAAPQHPTAAEAATLPAVQGRNHAATPKPASQ